MGVGVTKITIINPFQNIFCDAVNSVILRIIPNRHPTMNHKTVLLVQVVTLVSWLPSTLSYCTWAGANPYWTGTPTVEQVSGQPHGAPIIHLVAPIDPARLCK